MLTRVGTNVGRAGRDAFGQRHYIVPYQGWNMRQGFSAGTIRRSYGMWVHHGIGQRNMEQRYDGPFGLILGYFRKSTVQSKHAFGGEGSVIGADSMVD